MSSWFSRWLQRQAGDDYVLLPTNGTDTLETIPEEGPVVAFRPRRFRRQKTRLSRRALILFGSVALLFLVAFAIFAWRSYGSKNEDADIVVPHEHEHSSVVPLYRPWMEQERRLPQHNMSLPFPDGAHAKFLWAANHGEHFGWGNYMQEMVLNAYLAYASGRSYVFDNYTWDKAGPDIGNYHKKPTPARIPLSALISGPMIGGPMSQSDIPRAVSREYFLEVCPPEEITSLDTRQVQATLSPEATVSDIVEKWVTELNYLGARCIEISTLSPALFSYRITNTERVLDVFPSLSASPILADFGWSPLIMEEFYKNIRHFASHRTKKLSLAQSPTTPLKGLLTLHVRRGDYEEFCTEFTSQGGSFTGFNRFPELIDKYVFVSNDSHSTQLDIAMRHCLPSISAIVEKVQAVASLHIKQIYIMTNAHEPWLGELIDALRSLRHWKHGISHSRQLELSWEGKYVSEALDMYVGQRSEQFIGNGFSSLTSNVVMLRMRNPDLRSENTRFW